MAHPAESLQCVFRLLPHIDREMGPPGGQVALSGGVPAAPPARFGVAPLAPEPYPRPRPSGGAGPLGSNVRPLRFSGVQATVAVDSGSAA